MAKSQSKAVDLSSVGADDARRLLGVKLAAADMQGMSDWSAFRDMKDAADRKVVKAFFVGHLVDSKAKRTLKPDAKPHDLKSANNRFEYLAKQYAPATSRKKAGKGKAGAPEKTETGEAKQVSAKDLGLRLAAATAHAAKGAETFADNPAVVAWIGEQIAILNGEKKPEAKPEAKQKQKQ